MPPSARRQMRAPMPDVANAPLAQLQRRERAAAIERVGDADRARAGVGAADAQVAAAADGPERLVGERLGREVGGVALAGAAGVEAHARRARDRRAAVVDANLAPAPAGSGRRARARRGAGAAPRPARRGARRPRTRRSRRSRRAGSSVGSTSPPLAARRVERDADGVAQQRGGGDALARVGVQRAELGVRAKAGEPRVVVAQQASTASAIAAGEATIRTSVPISRRRRCCRS